MSAEETKIIIKKLKGNGFEVIANTLIFPDEIQQSTLLHSPFVQTENGVDILISALNDIGWIIPIVQPLFMSNHFYTKDSIGLFLLPDGLGQSDKVAEQDLVNVYQSNQCTPTITLHLKTDASYQIIHAKKNSKQAVVLKGKWKITSYPYLELTSESEDWSFYFEIQQKIETDVVGEIKLVVLKPVDTHYAFPSCSFVYGLRL